MFKFLPAVLGFALLAGCAPFDPFAPLDNLIPASAGNPAGDRYAGSPGSFYDASANPPKSLGTVAYDPYKAVPLPAGDGVPPAPSTGAMAMPAR